MIEAILKRWTEAQFQTWVKTTVEAVGGSHFHTRNSRGSEAGYPDSAIILPPRAIFAELKKVGGMPKPRQLEVLASLESCPGVEVYLWDPLDAREVEEILGIRKGRRVEPLLYAGLVCERCGVEFAGRSRRTRACSARCKAALWKKEGKLRTA